MSEKPKEKQSKKTRKMKKLADARKPELICSRL